MSTTNEPWRLDIDYHWTPRQREVLDLIARGLTNAEIAERLDVTLAGAKWHVSEVLSKLGVDSREEAAAYWKAHKSPALRIRRAFSAMTMLATSWKVAVGATSLAAIAGGTVFVASIAGGAGPPALTDAVPTPRPTHTPPPTQPSFEPPKRTSLDYVIATLSEPVERPIMAAYFTDRGICFTFKSAQSDANGEFSCSLYTSLSIPLSAPYLLSFGGSCPWTTISGMVPPQVDRVQVLSTTGDVRTLDLVPAPPELKTDGRFYFAAFRCDGSLSLVQALDADGNVLGSQELYDPLHAPVTTSHPPLAADSHTSGIGDPDGRGSVGGPAFAVPPTATTVMFDVDHQGNGPISIGAYCNTGIVDVRWVGPRDATNGSGVIAIDVPAGNVACHFFDIRAFGPWWIDGR